MQIKYLKWDTDFFGFKVGKLDIRSTNLKINSDSLKEKASKEGYKLVYTYIKENNPVNKGFDKFLVDSHISMEMAMPEEKPEKQFILLNEYNMPDDMMVEELFNITDDVATLSRFSRDPNIDKLKVVNLYREFIRNSIKTTFGDGIIIKRNKNKIIEGLFIPSTSGNTGRELLIGVDGNFRRNGIGRKLFHLSLNYWSSKGVINIFTNVSKNNVDSLNFHTRLGYNVKDVINIYHIWL
jgi:dTDP-4-amino-4,6-dideoxy-D-galactose acyltransferase